MTEEQWRACDDPNAMLHFLRGGSHPTSRKAKLFAVAACRRVWHLLPDERTRQAVEVAERFADGEATRTELAASQAAIRGVQLDTARRAAGTAAASAARHAAGVQRHYSTWNAVGDACWAAARATVGLPGDGPKGEPSAWAVVRAEEVVQAALLRDILGPLPFHTPRLDPRWRTPLLLSLARAAYQERVAPEASRPGWLVLDPARLLVLADALEDAGADELAILEHLRGAGQHVRGCWCVDLVLDRG
jgi:hypothetical protein